MSASKTWPKTLRVQDLRYRVGGAFALHADFEVRPGERVALTGRSGGGKTSLLRLIAGLETPECGRILLGDQDLTDLPAQRRGFGYVFQESALFPALTVLENVTFGLRMRGVARAERERIGTEALARVEMAALSGSTIARLSGGERQRIALLRATVWKPELLLLDEPFSALDSAMKERLRVDLLGWSQREAIPMLIVTHEVSDLEALATARIELREEGGGEVRHFVR